MKTHLITVTMLMLFVTFGCGKKIDLPERASATLSQAQRAKENPEHLKETKHYSVKYAYQAINLTGSAEMRIYAGQDEAQQAFFKDIPQRPLADISRNGKRSVRMRNAIWLLKGNTFTYYFFFSPRKDWESLPDNLKNQYSNGIKEFAEALVN